MGQMASAPIESIVLDVLKSLQESREEIKYTIEYHKLKFFLNKFPKSNHAPKCTMTIKDTSIIIGQVLSTDGKPIREKPSNFTIYIGEVRVVCKELNYVARVTGKISFYEVLVELNVFPKLAKGIHIMNLIPQTKVKKIKPQISLEINGVDHSRLVNLLLNIENPRVGGNIIDAIFLLLKETTLHRLNKVFAKISRDGGFIR